MSGFKAGQGSVFLSGACEKIVCRQDCQKVGPPMLKVLSTPELCQSSLALGILRTAFEHFSNLTSGQV